MSASPPAAWTEHAVAGVPVRLFDPPNPQAGGLIWLADFDGLTPESLPGWSEPLGRRGVRVVCPRPGPTWWLDRPDPGFQPARDRDDGATAWRFLIDALAPWAAGRFGGPVCWAGAGAGGQAVLRAGFRRHGAPPATTPAVWAFAPAVSLETVYGAGSTLDGLFETREQARVAGVLTDVNPLARPRRLRILCDPAEVWFPGCELLADKLRSGGVPLETDFESRRDGVHESGDRAAALNAAGSAAAGMVADALTFML